MKLKTLTLIVFLFSVIAACSQNTNEVDPQVFQQKLSETPDAQILDVRTPGEFKKFRIQGATNIDYNSPDFREHAKSLDKKRPVFIYCLSGGRSARAASWLRKQGYETVELKGGLLSWNNAKMPVEGAGAARGMSSSKFNDEVKSDKLVLVDFYARWCGPCKIMAPDLEALKEQYADKLVLMKVDADTNSFLVDSLRVTALPTLHLYKDGVQVWNHTGLLSKKEIEKSILDKL